MFQVPTTNHEAFLAATLAVQMQITTPLRFYHDPGISYWLRSGAAQECSP